MVLARFLAVGLIGFVLVAFQALRATGVLASDPKIVEAAKKESGTVMAYAGMRIDTAQKIWDLFHAKYPFLTVKQYRADSDKMVERVMAEQRAGKYMVDVLNWSGFHTQVMIERGIAGTYESPERQYYKPVFKDPKGFWTSIYYYPLTITYNTKLVPAHERPKNWPDLLHPRWKGRMAIEADQLTWYGGILKRFGEEKGRKFVQALAAQEVRPESGARGSAMMAAGEFAIFIGRGHIAQMAKAKGAPVDWIRNPDPLVVQLATIMLAKNAPNPHSAKLLIDFWLSEPIANLMGQNDRIPSRSGTEGVDQVYREIDVDKILPLSVEELRGNYKNHLEEFRSYFGRDR
jgi:iron(III) transport system substrate-binding protein